MNNSSYLFFVYIKYYNKTSWYLLITDGKDTFIAMNRNNYKQIYKNNVCIRDIARIKSIICKLKIKIVND